LEPWNFGTARAAFRFLETAMEPRKPKDPNETIPVDESDNKAPGIAPTSPGTMSRAEDDEITYQRSPEFHDQKAPESAQADKENSPHSWE
jgi:hypothetical protein